MYGRAEGSDRPLWATEPTEPHPALGGQRIDAAEAERLGHPPQPRPTHVSDCDPWAKCSGECRPDSAKQ